MNIESVLNKIELFEDLVINSGFKRDVADFSQAIQQQQNQNLVFMKDLSEKIQEYFLTFENNSLDTELKCVLRDNEPFTQTNTVEALKEIDTNEEIDGPAYFNKFNKILNQLTAAIESNRSEINSVKKVFKKYISDQSEFKEEEDQALISLIFKDLKSTSGLKEFSRVLNRWNMALTSFHQLVKSGSPEETSLLQIQNGSIDVIVNIDINVAIDLTELIKTGLAAYGAYLLYKSDKKVKEISDSFAGNPELVEIEVQKERLMLENIKISVKTKARELHDERLASDPKIDKTAIDGRIDSVSTTITDHIIKGNEVKRLDPPKADSDKSEEDTDEGDPSKELREKTAIVRERYKKLAPEEKALLLEKYSIKEEDENKQFKK
ncbi:MAG: hypothetical protein DHS20C02_16150 [Micavibrio sp.]|nr:MAG: hypothetical protein DHS20C02_16150 [Micavibrio sp.]